jgi:hypothetical protein
MKTAKKMKFSIQFSMLSFVLLVVMLVVFSKPAFSNTLDVSKMDFGTKRKLRTCPSQKEPTSGVIGVEQAKTYIACSYEERKPYNASVTFVDILQLEFGPKTRKVMTDDIMRWPNIDQDKPIYVLRGSIIMHSCANIVPGLSQKAGSNCTQYHTPKAKGSCWQDQFGEWFCFLGGMHDKEIRKQPAPQ